MTVWPKHTSYTSYQYTHTQAPYAGMHCFASTVFSHVCALCLCEIEQKVWKIKRSFDSECKDIPIHLGQKRSKAERKSEKKKSNKKTQNLRKVDRSLYTYLVGWKITKRKTVLQRTVVVVRRNPLIHFFHIRKR